MHRRSHLGRRAALAGAVALLVPAVAACSGDDSPSAASGSSESSPSESSESSGSSEAGSSAVAGGGADAVFPDDDWARGDAAEAGFDPAVLDEIAAEAEEGSSNCLVVTRHGRLVAEWYWNGTDATTAQEVFSATKSVTSTLVGIAQADGDLSVDDSAADYVPEWAGTPAAEVTVANLLSNDSGRHWDLTTDYQGLVGAADRTGFAVDLAQDEPPGTVWAYNNSAIQTLDAVLREATGEDPDTFARERLLDPLGMASSEMTRDGAGNTNTFFGLQSTCEDMARFGYLFLRRGDWDGEQIVPASWVEEATGRSSQDLNAAYGYLWWLNRRGPLGGPVQATTGEPGGEAPEGQMVPGAPEDMFWALGLGGQIVQVDPGSDTVVVRLGTGDRATSYGPGNTARVVTEALTEP